MNALKPGVWTQDTCDYSWAMVDRDGGFYRVAKAVNAQLERVWVTAWTEGYDMMRASGLRIGCYAYATADEAKAAIDNIANLRWLRRKSLLNSPHGAPCAERHPHTATDGEG